MAPRNIIPKKWGSWPSTTSLDLLKDRSQLELEVLNPSFYTHENHIGNLYKNYPFNLILLSVKWTIRKENME